MENRIPDTVRFAEPAEHVQPVPWDDFEAELLSVYQVPHVAKATRNKMKQVMKELRKLGVKTTSDLTTGLVARFCEARPPGQSDWTLQSLLMTLRSLSDLCRRFRIRSYQPFYDPPAVSLGTTGAA